MAVILKFKINTWLAYILFAAVDVHVQFNRVKISKLLHIPLQVIAAGSEPFVRHWSVNGEQRSQVPCTPTSVYSIAINSKSESTKVKQ